jgi:hypothetical protein
VRRWTLVFVVYGLCLGEHSNKSFGHGTFGNGATSGLDLKAPRQVHGSLENRTRQALDLL